MQCPRLVLFEETMNPLHPALPESRRRLAPRPDALRPAGAVPRAARRPRWLGPLALLLAGCASAHPAPVPATLVVGSDLDNPPFAGVAADGTPTGRDVAMMELLAERLGCRLVWWRLPFDALLDAVESGEVDVVCATIGITPERAEHVAFSAPYFATAIAAVVRAGPGEPRTLTELHGRRVAAARGTTSERAVRLALPAAVLVHESEADPPPGDRLLAGEIDAAVMDRPAADALVAAAGGRLHRLAEPLAAERYALVVAKGRGDLVEHLDRALAALVADGSLARLDARYGLAAR